MKVIQVVPDICDESAGPAYSVPATARGLAHCGVEVELFALGEKPTDKTFEFPIHVFPRHSFPVRALGRSPEMLRALRNRALDAQIIHTNSLWMFPNVYPDWAVKGKTCKVVLGPRGTVSEWALGRSVWKKKLFGYLCQYRAMKRADMFVARCSEEAHDLRSLGYSQPIAVVPNGIDVPEVVSYSRATRRRMYFLSRIHPKKNVELLVRCWARLEDRFPDWDLSIVGRDIENPYADQMKELVKRLGCKRVAFEGELRGETKNQFVASSECLVLPTHSENFGMVVAEALAWGTPAICSKGAPWRELDTQKAGWWIDATEDAFCTVMEKVMSMDRSDLSQYGKNGRDWMTRDFSWDGIGKMLKADYEWLLNGGVKPKNIEQCEG